MIQVNPLRHQTYVPKYRNSSALNYNIKLCEKPRQTREAKSCLLYLICSGIDGIFNRCGKISLFKVGIVKSSL